MKRISLFALLSMIAMPAIAQDTTPSDALQSIAQDAAATASEQVAVATEVATEAAKEEVAEFVETKTKSSFLHGLQIGVGLSATSGLNGFIGYANKDFDSFWAKRFGVRFDFATTSPIKSSINDLIDGVVDDGVDIGDNLTISDLDLKATHYAAMLDFYPFGDTWFLGGWRLTGGYYMGELTATAALAGTIDALDAGSYEFELGGHNFKYVGNSVHGSADLDWEYRGPYLGTGFDMGLFAGFKIYLDAGVVFTNRSAQLGLNVPVENLYMDGAPVNSAELESAVNDIVDETLADAQSELDDFKFYPMVKLGFMYRF